MRPKRSIISLVCGLGVVGCATLSEPPVETQDTPVERLTARNLIPGDCGLFVWSGDAERRFILFSQASKFSGSWLTDAIETEIKITDQSGNPANRQFPNVSYVSGAGTVLELELKTREPITNGTRFKSGTLKVTNQEGWDRVQPVVGLSACQPM